MIERFEQFSQAISSIYRYILKIEKEEMEKYGFRGSYALYLSLMARYPGGITATHLSELCGRDKAGISRVVAEMEEKGLVKRENLRDNLYRAKLVLTPEGRKAASFVRQRAKVAVEEAGHGLSNEDRATLYACLDVIGSNLKKICDDGIPSAQND